MSNKKENLIKWVVVFFVVVGWVLGFMYFSRFFNVECGVYITGDSTTVDCWKVN